MRISLRSCSHKPHSPPLPLSVLHQTGNNSTRKKNQGENQTEVFLDNKMVGNDLIAKKCLGVVGSWCLPDCQSLGWKSGVLIDEEGEISVFSTGLETPNTTSILRFLCFKKGQLCLLQVSYAWSSWFNLKNTLGASLSLFHG